MPFVCFNKLCNKKEDLTINLPDCRKKQLPEILANKSYELVAIYNMNYWLVEINVFE